jgi:hypothetical protein
MGGKLVVFGAAGDKLVKIEMKINLQPTTVHDPQ